MSEKNLPTCVILTNGNVFARIIVEPIFADRRWRVTGVVRITGDYVGRIGWRSAWWLAQRTTPPYLAYKAALAMTYRVAAWFGATAARDVESIAALHDLPVLRAASVSDAIVTEFIAERTPDVLVSVSCPQHIPSRILQSARRGCVNIHSSILPAYAGLAPYFWVLANGEIEAGTTVHHLVSRLDAGDVLVQRKIPIPLRTSTFALFHELARLGASALRDALVMVMEGRSATPQLLAARTYFSHPNLSGYIRLRRHGHRLFRVLELLQALSNSTAMSSMESPPNALIP